MPDAPGLELIRGEIERQRPGAVLGTSFDHGQAALVVDSGRVLDVLRWLREAPGQGYAFLSSLHGVDYLPAEPRFAVHYELLNRDRVERLRVKAVLDHGAPAAGPVAAAEEPSLTREGTSASTPPAEMSGELPVIDSCVELFPTADFQEREVYDFFGIVFRGHPELTRILMPEDYVGWPLRRDFPIGGEPVTFTYNEHNYG